MPKVVFGKVDPAECVGLYVRDGRRFNRYIPRKRVRLVVEGRCRTFPRGVIVDVPEEYLEIARHALPMMEYRYMTGDEFMIQCEHQWQISEIPKPEQGEYGTSSYKCSMCGVELKGETVRIAAR